jgi:hypothetical protein
MKKYMKKPIEIEAMQLVGTKASDQNIIEFLGKTKFNFNHDGLVIETLEGNMLCRYGDYIIKGVRGEYYPCARDIFYETYDEVK